MTNEEAKAILTHNLQYHELINNIEQYDALYLAINALEEKAEADTDLPEEHKPECEDCDYRKFTERFIDGVVDVMTKNGISSVEELNRRLKGEES